MRIFIFLFATICLSQFSIAQVRPKYNTIDKEFGLSKSGVYKNAISIGFTMNSSISLTDLDQGYKNANKNNLAYTFFAKKRIHSKYNLLFNASYGHLNGQNEEDNPDTFTSDFQSYSFSAQRRIIIDKKKNQPSNFQSHIGIGLGYHVSDVHLFQEEAHNYTPIKKRITAPYIVSTIECYYYITNTIGLVAGIDHHLFFIDDIDLQISNANNDAYLFSKIGIIINFD